MVSVVEVKSKKQQREFLNFPLRLYKGNPNFVPPLWLDEVKIFRSDYAYYDTCEAIYYNAYRDGKMVGRISGILQKVSNQIRQEKRVRFTRFDAIDDQEVASALFAAVEQWAKAKGMDTVCGPLGFSDLEREGLLIDGFEYLATFEEQYNAPYYARLIENCGYGKEVDWLERQIRLPDDGGDDLARRARLVEEKQGLHMAKPKSTGELLKRYSEEFFQLLDRCYAPLYGTVPFSDSMKKMMMDNFKLIIDLRYVGFVLDRDEHVVGMGLCFPSIARALQPSGGHLTPATLVRVLHSLNHPEILELGLIGVHPDYAAHGAAVLILDRLAKTLRNTPGLEFAETNLNLEDNTEIQHLWDRRFNSVVHKRRRSYVKKLS